MSLLSVDDRPPVIDRLHYRAGEIIGTFFKEAADATPAYNLAGTLYLSPSGYVLLQVPNALVRGTFAAMHEAGAELPPSGPDGKMNAHITVFHPEDLEAIGGPDKVTERGKQFRYSIGRLMEVEPDGWADMAKVWFLKVHSPELQALRRSYGLSSLPKDGKYDFHITVAVRRKKVLGRNDSRKGELSGAGASA